MTTEEYILQQRKRIQQIINEDKPLAIAASTIQAETVVRIFTKGIASSGDKIGNYDNSDPLYVNPKNAPRSFQPKGKTGKSTFLNGKRHKTGFFTSYKSFRSSQGRQTAFVDLKLSGDLQTDYANTLTRVNPHKWTGGVKRSAEKIDGNEERFGEVFSLTKDEVFLFIDVLRKERLKIEAGQ